MNDQNLDVNLIIQSFQEKLSTLMTELVVKDATIKQLQMQVQEIISANNVTPIKKDKNNNV
jgi:hypothetical protein